MFGAVGHNRKPLPGLLCPFGATVSLDLRLISVSFIYFLAFCYPLEVNCPVTAQVSEACATTDRPLGHGWIMRINSISGSTHQWIHNLKVLLIGDGV